MPSIKAGPTLSVPAGSVTTALMHHARVPGSNTTGGKKQMRWISAILCKCF